MKHLILTVTALCAFAALAQDANPQGKGSCRDNRPNFEPVMRAALNPKVAEKIGVTADQSAKLKELNGGKGELKTLQEKIQKGTARQMELLKAEKIDETAVMAAIDEVFEARKEVAKIQTRRLIAVKTILTPAQVKQAAELMKARKAEKDKTKGDKCKGGCDKTPPAAQG